MEQTETSWSSDKEAVVVGIETEYGLSIEGRGAEDQVEDAQDFVRAYPGHAFIGWDYRQEFPRRDLRGFTVNQLAFDPVDAQFDREPPSAPHVVRSDRVLANGARFYNDHGHPEYSTPECRDLRTLALEDMIGEEVMLKTANAFQAGAKLRARAYKNNTDYHGASYGTHESYLVPRSLGFERLYKAVMPVLVARSLLTGAGKVGAEHGQACDFQTSQRADFVSEPANVETLFRRPIFNTRDEPHGEDRDWIRLHVIAGDANMMPQCTMRKVALVRLAVRLALIGKCPQWELVDPVRSFKAVSRDLTGTARIDLKGRNWTTPHAILDALLAAGAENFDDQGTASLVRECGDLLTWLRGEPDKFRRSVDWAAKHWLLDQYREYEDLKWDDHAMQALCLEYHSLDEDEGLYFGLLGANEVEPRPAVPHIGVPCDDTRAIVRALAVTKFRDSIATMSWSSITWKVGDQLVETRLDPGGHFDLAQLDVESVEQFINCLQNPS